MAAKKKAKKKSTKKVTPTETRWRFVSDDDCHDYLIPAELKEEFDTWAAAGPYWENYVGEDFDIYRVDGWQQFTFTDPRSER
jgi:hypothetical protein